MNRSRSRVAALAAGIVACAGLALWASAGDLDPPPGPVMSTMKPLEEVEPRIPLSSLGPGALCTICIEAPGSYYLTDNFVGSLPLNGIEIQSDNVTLDLSGFSLIGSPSTLSGIYVSAPDVTSVVIRNGTIREWGEHGIRAFTGSLGSGVIVEDVLSIGNQQAGIVVGLGSIVRNCVARDNGLSGIDGTGARLFEGCFAYANGAGLTFGHGMQGAKLVRGCIADGNWTDGISVPNESLVVYCRARGNGQDGFAVNNGSQIQDCIAAFNLNDGISASSNCLVLNNTCYQNTDAGISLDGSGSNGARIDGNNVADNLFGLKVEGRYNVIIRNTAVANGTNYDIDPTNQFGPIVTGAGEITSGNPWANFEMSPP